MPYEDFQNDLFGGQGGLGKPKKKVFPGQRLLPNIKIPVEYTVIAAVAVMVLMILAYAIGVEKGKKMASVISIDRDLTENGILEDTDLTEQIKLELGREDTTPVTANSSDQESEDIVIDRTENEDRISDISEEITENVEVQVVPENVYTIQLASFRDLDSALNETEKLKDKGLEVEYTQRGDWYQVYATGYSTIEEAKEAQSHFIAQYGDCFIRKIK